MQFVKPTTFEEAVDKLGTRTPMGSKFSSSEWQDVPVALRERAMFSSRIESARFLQRAKNALDDFLQGKKETLPNGQVALATGGRTQFIELMRELAIAEGIGPLAGEPTGGLTDITSERRLGLIFDTQTRQAQDYGYWKQGQDSDVLNEFPAQRFIRVRAVKQERDSHQRFEDQVYLKNDPIWSREINEDFGVPWGPWAWGCGHDVEDVDRDEAEQLGLLKPGDQVVPDSKSFNENLKASAAGLEPELVEKLKAEFGDRMRIVGGEMRWAGEGSTSTIQPPVNVQAPTSKLEPKPEPAVAPAPEPERTPQRGVPTAPVSKALDLQVRGDLKAKVAEAVRAIDAVHDDGTLPVIPLKSTAQRRTRGFLRFDSTASGDFVPIEIGIRGTGAWPGLTAAHEVGHLLDLSAIGRAGQFATMAGADHPEMLAVIGALQETAAIKELRRLYGETTNAMIRKQYRYLLDPKEQWARAYAQFIAERAGSGLLANDLAAAVAQGDNRQWTKEDFAPVAAAIETMFKKLGWMRTQEASI